MNDMVPDAASFLANMPLLDDTTPERAAVVQKSVSPADSPTPSALGDPPDQVAEDAIPDSTAFLMEGFAAAPETSPPGDAAADGAVPAPGLLPPSVALTASRLARHDVLENIAGAGTGGVLSTKLGFHVGDLRFFVPFDGASELSEMVPVFRLPNVPSWFRGLANLRGNLVPVFDVAAMIGFRGETGRDRMLLVLGHGPMAAGMVVNELPTRIRLESATEVERPELPGVLQDCVPRAYLHGEEVWLELQYQRFFETTASMLAP